MKILAVKTNKQFLKPQNLERSHFRKRRRYFDGIFKLRLMIDKSLNNQTLLNLNFVGYDHAFVLAGGKPCNINQTSTLMSLVRESYFRF